jgi:hypothetical protein
MAEFYPIASSAPREPDRRPRPIPAKIKAVVHFLVWGDDDPDKPLDLIPACRAAGVTPFVMRRYLDRPAVIAHLHAEQRKRREVDCCGNSAALKRVRDASPNGMVTVAAARALGGMQAEDEWRADAVSPGITLRIISAPIDITPKPPPRIIDAE